MSDLTTIPTPDLVRELCSREECIAVESLKPPADIFPWYMVKHQFDQYYPIPGPARIIVVQGWMNE